MCVGLQKVFKVDNTSTMLGRYVLHLIAFQIFSFFCVFKTYKNFGMQICRNILTLWRALHYNACMSQVHNNVNEPLSHIMLCENIYVGFIPLVVHVDFGHDDYCDIKCSEF